MRGFHSGFLACCILMVFASGLSACKEPGTADEVTNVEVSLPIYGKATDSLPVSAQLIPYEKFFDLAAQQRLRTIGQGREPVIVSDAQAAAAAEGAAEKMVQDLLQ